MPKPGKSAKPARNGKPARPAKLPECDPYFGFSRSFYFKGETLGYWKLVRICDPGKTRGVTLIPYDQIARFVRSQMEDAK